MERRVTPIKRVTSPTWSPPPSCKQALRLEKHYITTFYLSNIDLLTKTFLNLPTLAFQGDFGKRAAYHFGSGVKHVHALYSSFIKCKSQLVGISWNVWHVGASDLLNVNNREEKSLRLDDNKPKRYLKLDSHCFKVHRSYYFIFI